MSAVGRGEGSDGEALDENERKEVAWLEARGVDPDAPAPSAAVAGKYERLEELLTTLPAGTDDDAWQEKVRAAAMAPAAAAGRRTGRWTLRNIALGAGALAAAAVALVYVVTRSPAPAELEVTTRRGEQVRSLMEVAIDDVLVVTVWPRGVAEVRIFGTDGSALASCPGVDCDTSGRTWRLERTLSAPGMYRVVVARGATGAPAGATFDQLLEAARAANVRVDEPIKIRVH